MPIPLPADRTYTYMVCSAFKTRPQHLVIGSEKRHKLTSLWIRQTSQHNCSCISFYFKGVLLWKWHGLGRGRRGLSRVLQHEEPEDISPTPKERSYFKRHSQSTSRLLQTNTLLSALGLLGRPRGPTGGD